MTIAEASRAMGALLSDPDDTSQVFRIIEALSGRTPGRITSRLRRSERGRRILREKPNLLAHLQDRPALAAHPTGSFARAYLRFTESEGISAAGLIDASVKGTTRVRPDITEDERFVGDRMRDAHDLWHVATGYRGDLIGEASLLAFTFAQTRNRGVGFIVAMALLKAPEPGVRGMILDGYRRGRRAEWLPAVEWEELLDEPLWSVRQRLRMGPAPAYDPVRTGDLEDPLVNN